MVLTPLRQQDESDRHWFNVPSRKAPSLAERIERALRATGCPALHTIDVSVQWSVVVLQGRVSSFYMKRMAQAIVLAVPGIWEFCNELEVISLAVLAHNKSYQVFKQSTIVERFHDRCQEP
jgi:BON domain